MISSNILLVVLVLFIIAAIVLLAITSMMQIRRDTNRIHTKIAEFRDRTTNAKTIGELLVIRAELVAYANKECWHSNFADHAKEVLSYIDGRLSPAVSS